MQAVTDNAINSGAYAKPPSQDRSNKRTINAPKPSQDEIPLVDDLEASVKVLYDRHRDDAYAITQSIKFQAYSDAFSLAIGSTHDLSPNFLQGLASSYTPILLNNVPSRLLIASGVDGD